MRAVVFDMDGVLIDSEPIWRDVEQRVFAGVGLDLDDERCRETMGLRVNEVVEHWFSVAPWSGRSTRDVERAIVRGVVDAVRGHGSALPGVDHALSLCVAAGVRTAIASSSYETVIRAVLDRLGLAERFDVVVSAQHLPQGKPHPAVYLQTAAALDVAPGACLAIEDSVNGVRAAVAAGMRCIAIPEAGSDAAPLRAAGAEESLASLLGLRPEHLAGPGSPR